MDIPNLPKKRGFTKAKGLHTFSWYQQLIKQWWFMNIFRKILKTLESQEDNSTHKNAWKRKLNVSSKKYMHLKKVYWSQSI